MTLSGSITITKRMRRHSVWQRPDYGWAWVDVLLLANDADRIVMLNGEQVEARRGQMVWSVRGLEKEWQKSAEWIDRFLGFCADHDMLRVEKTKRFTRITVLNYDAYNPVKPDTQPDSDSDTETGTTSDTEPERKREEGRGIGKGEGHPPEINVPSNDEVEAFCAAYPGDLARGIPATIPEHWWAGWLAVQLRDLKRFPADWKRSLLLAFRADFLARHPKLAVNNGGWASGFQKKGEKTAGRTGVQPDGRSAAQAAFENSRELEEVRERLNACYETNVPPNPADVAREKELEAVAV